MNRPHLPCPDCGCRDLSTKVQWIAWTSCIRCNTCGHEGPKAGRNGTDDSAAWAEWDDQ